jgi:hypothetical protein
MAPHAEMVHQGPQVVAMREGSGDHLRLAEAAEVGRDHAMGAGEFADLVVPHAAVADAGMEQQQGGPSPARDKRA